MDVKPIKSHSNSVIIFKNGFLSKINLETHSLCFCVDSQNTTFWKQWSYRNSSNLNYDPKCDKCKNYDRLQLCLYCRQQLLNYSKTFVHWITLMSKRRLLNNKVAFNKAEQTQTFYYTKCKTKMILITLLNTLSMLLKS